MADAFRFNGNGWVDVPDDPIWTLGTDDFTIDLWVRFNSLSGRDPLIAHDNGGGQHDKWIFWYDANGHDKQQGIPALRFHTNTPQGPIHDAVVAPWNPVVGSWYHVGITRSGNSYALYINGTQAGTDTSTFPIPDPVESLTIGRAEGFRLNGAIDEVEIFDRALSASEIQAIFDAGSAGKCKVPIAAAITGAPAHKVLPGETINLGSVVTDDACETHTYNWTVTKDGQPFASGTSDSLTFTPDTIGVYDVTLVVTDNHSNSSEPATASLEAISSSLSGLVWMDFNNNSQVDFGENGISGVMIHLAGTDDLGQPVSRAQSTDSDGAYVFLNLRPGSYSISEAQPTGFDDGLESLGTAGGTVAADAFQQIALGENQDGFNYNFGERDPAGGQVESGQSAPIGFWQNRKGQDLIKSLNGGSTATNLGSWLAVSFPNMFGSNAGANDLSGMTNADVGAFYQQKFKVHGMKLDAQVMATALSVYVTKSSLGGTVATQYGFVVSSAGLGNSTFSVGNSGAAFGVANGTSMRVIDILLAVDAAAVGGVLYDGNAQLRPLANEVFDAINTGG